MVFLGGWGERVRDGMVECFGGRVWVNVMELWSRLPVLCFAGWFMPWGRVFVVECSVCIHVAYMGDYLLSYKTRSTVRYSASCGNGFLHLLKFFLHSGPTQHIAHRLGDGSVFSIIFSIPEAAKVEKSIFNQTLAFRLRCTPTRYHSSPRLERTQAHSG